MAYISPELSAIGTEVLVETRGKSYQATIVPMPFVANSYHRKPTT